MNEYLPPIVTELKADISDLVRGFAEARALGKAYVTGMKEDLKAGFSDMGTSASAAFGTALRKNTTHEVDGWAKEAGQMLDKQARDTFKKGGETGAAAFMTAMRAAMMPLLIGLLILITPMIATAIGAAVLTGFGLGFIGLGAFLLREEPKLIAAAVQFKTTLKTVFGDAAKVMLQPLTDALGIFTKELASGTIGKDLKEIFANIAPAIVPLAQGISGFFRELFAGLKDASPAIRDVLIAFADTLPELGKGFGDMLRSIAAAAPALVRFWKEFGGEIATVLRFLGDFIEIGAEIYLFMVKLHDKAVEEGWDTPWKAVATGAQIAWRWIKDIGIAIGHWFADLGRGVKDWAVGAWNSFVDFLRRSKEGFSNWIEGVKAWLRGVPSAISDAIGRSFDTLFYVLGYAFVRTGQLIMAIPPMILAWILQTKADLLQWAAETVVGILLWWQDFKARLPLLLAEAAQAVWNWAVGIWRTSSEWTARTYHAILDWWKRLPAAIWEWAQNAVARVKQWASDIYEWSKNAGKNLVEGLVSGVKGAIDWGVDQVKRAMEKIKQGAKDAFGIKSPSTAFAEMGRNSMLGYVLGLQGEQGRLRGVWDGMLAAPAGGGSLNISGHAGDVSAPRGPRGPGDEGGMMVETTINIDGERVVTAITPAAQRIKTRSGTTGLD